MSSIENYRKISEHCEKNGIDLYGKAKLMGYHFINSYSGRIIRSHEDAKKFCPDPGDVAVMPIVPDATLPVNWGI